jgi:DNA-binding transcriptional regulator GbsR (MarR family)
MEPPRDDATHGDELLQFVEQVAASFERMGLFRMAGRVIGWLLVCDPPEQTFAQLVDVLQASKASISGAMRFLVASRWVERFSKPGDRRSYYRLRTDAMSENARRQVEVYREFADLMESGLRAVGNEKPQRRARLEEMYEMYAFLDRELPIVWDHWEKQRAGGQGDRDE